MSIWSDMEDRSMGLSVRKEDAFKVHPFWESAEQTNLRKSTISAIEEVLKSLHDVPRWSFDCLSDFGAGLGDLVVLSDKKKTYLEVFVDRHLLPENENDWEEGAVKILGASRVLGEYDDGEIILYVNNIMDAAKEEIGPKGVLGIPYLTVLRYVYLHELMHAYFDRKGNEGHEYNYETDEGFAEFGALLLLNKLVKHDLWDEEPLYNHASKEELEWAIRHVERKTGFLQCYARGAELFKQFGEDKELCKKMLQAFPKEIENNPY